MKRNYQDYTVGWICALEVEYLAACEMLDDEHDLLPRKSHNDSNAYTLGHIKNHNVAIACLPQGQYGIASAATVASNMLNTFEAIRIGLMVGIEGGAPSTTHDVRLGDVVVGTPSGRMGGVVPYDHGKLIQDKKFEFTGHLNASPTMLLTALTRLEVQHKRKGNRIAEVVSNMTARNPRLKKTYGRPKEDRLYVASFIHTSDQPCRSSCGESVPPLVPRSIRDPEDDESVVHFGTIASANKLMKDANVRNSLNAEYGVLCFEMEAAALMNNFPCLVIRGICYGAAAAAAYAQQLLESIPADEINERRSAKDEMEKLEKLEKLVQETHDDLTRRTEDIVQNYQRKEEEDIKQRLLNELSPLECLARQQSILQECFPTRQRLLESEEFKYWSIGEPWQLRLYGSEGTGKTVLSAFVVDDLRHRFVDQNKAVLYLCPHDPERGPSAISTPRNLVGCLLKQLVQRNHDKPVSRNIKWLYEAKQRGEEPDVSALFRVFKAEMVTFDRVYLIIDALDEYTEISQEWLTNDLMGLDPDKLSIMASSRELEVDTATEIQCDICKTPNVNVYVHCKVCENFDICRNCKEKGKRCEKDHELDQPGKVYFRVRTAEDDITRYIKSEVAKELGHGKSLHWDTRKHTNPPGSSAFGNMIRDKPELEDSIPLAIANKTHGNFRLAKDYMNALRHEVTAYAIDKALKSLPDQPCKHYERQLERLKTNKHRKHGYVALKVLSLVALARRALGFAELQHVLVMVLEPKGSAFNHSMVIRKKDVLAMTQQLVVVDSDDIAGVTLYDEALHVYLNDYQEDYPDDVVAQAQMAQACLTYLTLDAVSQPCETLQSFEAKRKEFPFIAYASQHWGDHVRLASNPKTNAMAVDFLKNSNHVAACAQAAWLTSRPGPVDCTYFRSASALHFCAWFGLTSVISSLHNGCLNIDISERIHRKTPLMYACKSGHVDVVRQLLDLGASVNASSLSGETPIFVAIAEDRKEIVGLLLSRPELQINTGNPEQLDRIALLLAVRLGNLNITQKLLKIPGIDVNKQDVDGYTALSIACAKGHSEIVRILLEQQDVNTNLTTHVAGLSALMLAVSQEDATTVRLLLDCGADPHCRDNNGGSAVAQAVESGSILAIKIMLEHHIDLRTMDDEGRSLVHLAAMKGHTDVIRILSERGLQLNCQDIVGSTPLHEASRHGKIEAADALLNLGADQSIKDHDGNLAIEVAWQYWKTEVVNLLASRDPSEECRTMVTADGEERPIWALVKAGRLDLIERAMIAGKIDFMGRETRTNSNALHNAVLAESKDILSFLLQNGGISPNDSNHHQRTPLHLAAIIGNVDATKQLLANRCTDLGYKDRWGGSPLSIASYLRHFGVAVILIEAGANFNLKNVDRNLQALFLKAVELGSVGAVQALINKGADVLRRNDEGDMALHIAQKKNDGEMMHILRSSSSFFYETSDYSNGTKRENDGLVDDAAPSRRRRMGN